MRIDRITIKDFRLYKGFNEVKISHNIPSKNINIIAGQNGYGKTTFLTSVIWGFYGKLMVEVDENFKREIYEAGGYKKYAQAILNRGTRLEKNTDNIFSVELELTNLNIPSVPCNSIIIKREYDISKDSEKVSILIDGFVNELTNQVGPEIFINDFILPREIAKFFLFDAERIVSLAEIKTIAEKQKLSSAYSEVLGISKYEKLKRNLENLRIKLRKRSASLSDRNKLDKMQTEAEKIDKLIRLNEEKIQINSNEIKRYRDSSDQFQEKLIREGNDMSLEEMIKQKKLRDKLKEQGIEIKAKLHELLELAPFAISGVQLVKLKKQIDLETKGRQYQLYNNHLYDKLLSIKKTVNKQMKGLKIEENTQKEIIDIITNAFKVNIDNQGNILDKVLLDLTSEQSNEFNSLFDNIRNSFSLLFKQIVKEERNNRIFLTNTLRKISNAEAKESDILITKYKKEKANIDKRIEEIENEQNRLFEEMGAFQQELSSKSKVISELAKTVTLDDIDNEKDKIAERLIIELSKFLYKFKTEKKISLQDRIRNELHILMHKEGFIESVEVVLEDDIIDIILQDKEGNIVNKETLSKGEQQLFATAMLKSLVDESGFEFPIFIDSPLQKFDKKHSKNIITKFYPSISSQVIILPLVEKELTKNEYLLMSDHINQTFIIKNKNNNSIIEECKPDDIYKEIEVKI